MTRSKTVATGKVQNTLAMDISERLQMPAYKILSVRMDYTSGNTYQTTVSNTVVQKFYLTYDIALNQKNAVLDELDRIGVTMIPRFVADVDMEFALKIIAAGKAGTREKAISQCQ